MIAHAQERSKACIHHGLAIIMDFLLCELAPIHSAYLDTGACFALCLSTHPLFLPRVSMFPFFNPESSLLLNRRERLNATL